MLFKVIEWILFSIVILSLFLNVIDNKIKTGNKIISILFYVPLAIWMYNAIMN